MNTLTMLKKLAKKDDLIVIPRKEYEFLKQRNILRKFSPTVSQKKALLLAEKNFKNKKTLSYNNLVSKLGFTN
ncbi:MAG: hypothetical protein Q8P06_00285 [Candidatus Azambacteria bacterium]|nr:hypothetical protein [Candidatus Azambacteria bacterium]